MPITYDIETDYLYQKGIEKGIEKERREKSLLFVKNLLSNTDFSDDKIALLANVDTSFVKEARAKMELPSKRPKH